MNELRERFNNKKYMAENFRADMSRPDFLRAANARGEMLAELSHGKKNAYTGRQHNGRKNVRFFSRLPASIAKLKKAA